MKRFVEKPDVDTARSYLEAGNYIWNSGMFVWRVGEFLRALEEHLPDTYRRLSTAFASGDWAQMEEAYGQIEDISVDFAIMEKTRRRGGGSRWTSVGGTSATGPRSTT